MRILSNYYNNNIELIIKQFNNSFYYSKLSVSVNSFLYDFYVVFAKRLVGSG